MIIWCPLCMWQVKQCSYKVVCVLIPRIYGCVTCPGKKNSADVTKLRILRWRNYSGFSRYVQCNHQGPYKRETLEAEALVVPLLGMGASATRFGQLLEARTVKKWILPQSLKKEHSSADRLLSGPLTSRTVGQILLFRVCVILNH